MELVSWKYALQRGKPTALKVNLGWDLFIPGSITSPWVVEGVILAIRDWVGPLYVVESDQVLENIEKAYRTSGLPAVCKRYGVTWVNMSHAPASRRELPGAKVFSTIELPDILTECQIVTIPVMKTHAKTRITGSLKNQWGCISKLRHNYHLTLSDALADINAALRPAFAVMDATVALEGNGPKSGRPKIVNRVLASADLVALDTVQAKLMGLDPGTIEHLQRCAERGIGTTAPDTIDIIGDPGASTLTLGFEPARHNLVSRIEELLRRSRWKWLFFDTPIFLIMLLGAKIWYLIWFYAVSGRKHWNTVLADSRYGPLWKSVLEGREP
jgi:uncharacterized protein (DUF362 family)